MDEKGILTPVILAGGSGTRLWPLSRKSYPKQFLRLIDPEWSMLQLTLKRLDNLDIPMTSPIIICNEEHRFIVAEQLRQIGIEKASILLEPVGKNTAPAITLAALQAQALYLEKNPALLVLASDHHIVDIPQFHRSILSALTVVQQGMLVVFGVTPYCAHTGYGYIKLGQMLEDRKAYQLAHFVEKPDLATSKDYLESQSYLWNSGMFLFGANSFLNEVKKYQPEILASCKQSFMQCQADLDFIRINPEAFKDCPEDSIDYAVMEHTTIGAVVRLEAGWNDLGSWESLWESSIKDEQQNVVFGDVLIEQGQNNYVHASSRLVTVLGVDDLIVVETKDAILVANKTESQLMKKIVEDLTRYQRTELSIHREVIRPWGKYDSIDVGERYQVKRITVNPKSKLSLQLHHHRAEHWIVVKGTAKVTRGDEKYFISENESTYIPIGTIHSLENPGSIPLELIEIQSGAYLGEDDIVRLKDDYGRVL
ncbi:mannose-1-phosphate guanylyltransferase/mannose-6-phosphate isomerase [Alkanindiges illinoisensis]|uniref:mannose-1-phosphate guanylyltransferase/mannose-6-phosphate isomerase n=1 Tax=Alkanindiges illinoisensis TaxID=197183 RepID=UPI000556E834|nr:mannose-1-phosphate guanylyltransferase/mannose-6-phosphate isomerase [Alkanindiges illinoisensis]